MKKQILGFMVMLAACSLGMSSCGINHSQYSEDIIPWVYEHVYPRYTYVYILDENFQKNRYKEFADEYKYIEDTHEYAPFCELADYVGGNHDDISEVEQYAKKILTEPHSYDHNYSWYEYDLLAKDYSQDSAEYYNSLFLAELETTAKNIQNYWMPWKEYYNEYILSHTQILDQGFDSNNIGELYTGYYAIYALTGVNFRTGEEEVKYALVSITEYDDDSRYEYQLLATADSLKEINQYLE